MQLQFSLIGRMYYAARRLFISKCLLAMKLTCILLTAVLLQAAATGYTQTITLSVKNAPLSTVFKEIEKQTGFVFLYTDQLLQDTKPVDLQVKDVNLQRVLDLCLKDQPVDYRIVDGTIIIRPKAKSPKVESHTEETSVTITVKGRITLETGEPVAASVTVKNTTLGTTTNAEGFFELPNVEPNAVLLITGTSIQSQELKVNGRTTLNVVAKVKITEQEEVVINAGYYKVRRVEQTGSIGRVSAKEIEKQPVLNPLAAMQGRITGAFIQQTSGIPGGDFKIEIRGRNSLRDGGNEPLYIVDGVPFSTERTSSRSNTFQTGANPLNTLNNADIESIEVLKDADATAIYGSRGANGVILITTKKGKVGKTKFSLDVYSGGGKAPILPLLNSNEYLAMRREAFANEGYTSYPASAYDVNGVWDASRYTNWQKILIGGTARSSSVQASLTGGSDGTQFLFSTGYRNETSVVTGGFEFTKLSSHFSLNHITPNKKLTAAISFTGAVDNNKQIGEDYTNQSRRLAPNSPALYKADGSLNWENSTWTNPLAYMEKKYQGNTYNFVSNAVIGYVILPGLQIKSSFGFTQSQTKEKTLLPSSFFDPSLGITSARSEVIASNGTNQSWIIEPQLQYENKVGPGQLSVLVGTTFQEQQLDRVSDSYANFPSNSLLLNLSTAANKRNNEYIVQTYRYSAVFGRLNYSIDKKYILNLTGRRDGSSRFGPGRQFANFGAAGIAWVFTKEDWLPTWLSVLNFGKLRASYGATGNDQIGNYEYLDTYGPSQLYQGVIGLDPVRLFNPDFSWEVNKKLEVAIDLSFLKDRISLAAGWYQNRCSNQLITYALPMTTGFTGIRANFPATVQNKGWELELSTLNVKQKNFSWTSSFNLTIPENKLISFPGIESSSYANTYIVGQSIYIRKVYESTGVDPVTGLFTFKDYNSDGKVTLTNDDRKAVAITQQFYGGLNNSLSYKNWSLDIFLQIVRQTGYNYWKSGPLPGAPANQANFVIHENRWTKPGDIASMQRYATEFNVDASNAFLLYRESDAALGDASFIRVKNLALTYRPAAEKLKGIQCSAYIQAQNLFTITKFKGYDPESQFANLGPLKMLTAGIRFSL